MGKLQDKGRSAGVFAPGAVLPRKATVSKSTIVAKRGAVAERHKVAPGSKNQAQLLVQLYHFSPLNFFFNHSFSD